MRKIGERFDKEPKSMARAFIGSTPTNPFPFSQSSSTLFHKSSRLSSAGAMPDHRDPLLPPPQPHPSLEIVDGARGSFLPALKTLLRPYTAFPVVGWNRHVETIFAAFFRSVPDVRLRRECIRTKDDGSVALDWVSGDDRSLSPDSPLLILLPGLTGGSDDSYFYSASFLGDMHEVVAHVGARYPKANLYAVGWSLGANILVRYLGQESDKCPLSGAVSLCNPFNLVIADEDFRKGFNNVYDKALSSALCKIFKKHALLFEDIGGDFNIPLAANAKTVREFDEGLTRVSFGFKSVDDYYFNSSSSDSIKDVCRPLLCIQAANDPIAPNRGIPRKDIKENPNCLLIVTPQGGHLGWVAGDEAPIGAPWTDTVVIDFLEHLEREASSSSSSSSSNTGSIVHHMEV
ncbi:hypothetical protein F8388_013216 [Cannabis sativa]|uniref:AB hydrolase-1 domain-containing protein n=1 Tax=Cannabis sativa TaxID=3483 RepID=A0A7J6DYG6_CANSA|nr:hypothetical protein F8388_013216 [Cannabis sativa]